MTEVPKKVKRGSTLSAGLGGSSPPEAAGKGTEAKDLLTEVPKVSTINP
jgi:hypothetical protein